MHYSIAIVPALAALVSAAPSPVEPVVHAIKVAELSPARITDISAEATRVMRIMNQQSPQAVHTKPVTVTGKPVTLKPTAKPAPTKKPVVQKTTKKTTKRKTTTTKKVKQHKRAVTTQAKAVVSTSAATTSTTTTTTRETNVNNACGVQPTYQPYYPPGNASDPEVFLKDPTINSNSQNAGNVAGYQWMWSNYMMQTSTRGFLGIYQLSSYNVSECAARCDSTNYCKTFNIFYERDPSLAPAPACPTPAPIGSIRCTLWDAPLDIYTATNYGQWRGAFAVVVAGSNGYSKQ